MATFAVQQCVSNGPTQLHHSETAAGGSNVLTDMTTIGTPNGSTTPSAYSECFELLTEALSLSRNQRQRALIRECINRLKNISDAQDEKINSLEVKLLEATNLRHQENVNSTLIAPVSGALTGPNVSSSYRGLPAAVELNYYPDLGFQIGQPTTLHYQDHGSVQISHELGDRITLVATSQPQQTRTLQNSLQQTIHLQQTTLASSNILTLPSSTLTSSITNSTSTTGPPKQGRKRRLLQQHKEELQQQELQQQLRLLEQQQQQEQQHQQEQIHLALIDGVHVQIHEPTSSNESKESLMGIHSQENIPAAAPTSKPKSKRSLEEANSTRKMRKSRAIPEEYLNANNSVADYDIVEDCKDKYQALRQRLGNDKVNAVLVDLKNGSMKVMLSLGLVIRGPTVHNGMDIPPTSYACNFDPSAECAKKVFVHNLSFLRHVCVDHFEDVKPHRCPQCPYRSYLRQQLNNHFAQHSKQARYYCDREGCEYFTNIKGQYIKHIDNHDGFKRFRCTIEGCTNAYTTRKNLREHMNVHKGVRPHVCKICGAKFFRKATLFQHKRNHKKPFACDVPGCEYRTGVPQNLSAHMVHQHHFPSTKPPKPKKELTPEQRQKRLQYQKTKRYFCSFEGCTQGFTGKNKLDDHMRIHTNEKPFICETCGKCFRRRYALKKHQVSKHTTAKDKPFYCASCDLGFFLCHHLERHNDSKRHKMMVEVGGTSVAGPLLRLKANDILPQSLTQKGDLVERTSQNESLPTQKPKRGPIKKRGTAAIGMTEPLFEPAQTLNQPNKKTTGRKVANRSAKTKAANKKQANSRQPNSLSGIEDLESEHLSEEESEEEDESEHSDSDESESEESESEIAETRRKLIAAALMRSKGNTNSLTNNTVTTRKAPSKRATRQQQQQQQQLATSNATLLTSGFNPGEFHVIEFPSGMTLNGAGHLVSAQDVHFKQEQEIGAEVDISNSVNLDQEVTIHEVTHEIVANNDSRGMDDHSMRSHDDASVVIGEDGSVQLHHSSTGSILTDDDDAISHAMSLSKREQMTSTSCVVTGTTVTLAGSSLVTHHPHLDDDFGFVGSELYYTDNQRLTDHL